MPRPVGTWYFEEETYTGYGKEENALFSLPVLVIPWGNGCCIVCMEEMGCAV